MQDIETNSPCFDYSALSLDLQALVNRERKVLYEDGDLQWHLNTLPPIVSLKLLSGVTGEALGVRKLSSISMLLHTAGRFRPELEQKLADRSNNSSKTELLVTSLNDEDVPSEVFDAVIDYIDVGNGASSLQDGDEPALIQAAAYIGMEPFLTCLPRHMRWRHMSVERVVMMLTTCLRFWPRFEFIQPALKSLGTSINVRSLANGAWQTLLPVGGALMGLWPNPAKQFLGIGDNLVAEMQRGEKTPHERVLLFMVLFAMLCSAEEEDASALEEVMATFRTVADVVCPFPCPAAADMCAYALGRIVEGGSTAAAYALRIMHSHFIARGLCVHASPAQIVPLWDGDTAEWGALPSNRAVGISLSASRVRMLVRLSNPGLRCDDYSDADVSVKSSCVSFCHEHGVHDFSLELRKVRGHDFDRVNLLLHRRCQEQAPGTVTLLVVKFAVLSHWKSKRLIPHVLTEHLGAIECAHFEDVGMRPANDCAGDEGVISTTEEFDMFWDHLCQSYVDPALSSIVCCVDINVESREEIPIRTRCQNK